MLPNVTDRSKTMHCLGSRYLVFIAPILIALAGCASDGPNDPGDGRPPGTWRVLIPFSDQCVLTDETKGYVYDDFPTIGGTLLYEVEIINRSINLYLPEGDWVVLEVKDGDDVLADPTRIYASNRDIQREPPLDCQ